MARYGLNIEKTMLFRGVQQPFGNTYYYEAPVGSSQTVTLNDLIDDVLAIDRDFHCNNVTYVRARLWTADGGPAQNNMIIDRSLSGTGSGGIPLSGQDRERAYLIRFRAGVDSKGRPVYLRKWYHGQISPIGGQAVTSAMLENTATLTSASRTALETIAEGLKGIEYTAGQTWDLVGPTGRGITGSTQCHAYLEHHQLGDQWRDV
jgi:hypothetical protein